MAIQTINVGNIVNDGLGDDLRTAFQKVNANFVELSTTSTTTASNAGSSGLGIFKRKVGADLEFKRLAAGNKTQLVETENSIVINSTQPDAFTRILTDEGIASADFNTSITLQGGTNIDVKTSGSVITVGETINTVALISTVDFGPITGLYENAVQFILAGGDYDFGTFLQGSDFEYDAGAI
jgi:hypothetical protein